MEYLNSKNIIYINEENGFRDTTLNIKKEVDDAGKEICSENDKIIKTKEVKHEILREAEPCNQVNDIRKDAVENIAEESDHNDLDSQNVDDYVEIKEEDINFMEYQYQRTFVGDVDDVENDLSSSLKNEDISPIEYCTSHLNSSNEFEDHCELSTSNKIKLNLETYKRIDTDEKLKCSDSDNSDSFKSKLKKLSSIHQGENPNKPFKCDECSYSASQKALLTSHKRNHTGEAKPLKCDFCSYTTSEPISLRMHTRTHTGERPYSCVYCDYSATQKAHLIDHTRIHTGAKPFRCSQCDFCTSRASSLNRHLKIHTGEKNFKCNICEFATSRKTDLHRHIKIHIGEKEFECDDCGHKMVDKASLRRHSKTHTKINKNKL